MNMLNKDSGTLRSALRGYFADNGFGEDGGYSARWVDFKIGPIPFRFPNTNARRDAVRYHDLHHIVTGYGTDLTGEFEISAWEIGSGCKKYLAAWQLNLGGMGGGILVAPLRCFRAFRRGRRSENFYGRPYDSSLLDLPVSEAAGALGVDAEVPATGAAMDLALFSAATFAGLVTGIVFFVLVTPLAVLSWPALYLARGRKETATPA